MKHCQTGMGQAWERAAAAANGDSNGEEGAGEGARGGRRVEHVEA